MRKNSIKNTMINSEVMRAVSEIIRSEIRDPRVAPVTSVTDAEVTTDLKYATIYISTLGEGEKLDKTMEALKQAAGFIRRELAKRVNLRNTPELRFVADTSLAYGMKMSRLIDEVAHKDEEKTQDDQ